MKDIVKIGIIGCGTIGKVLIKYIINELDSKAKLIYLCDINKNSLVSLKQEYNTLEMTDDYNELIKNTDFIIESASAFISKDITEKALKAGKDVMVLSVGGMIDCFDEVMEMAANNNCGNLYIPSGAIAGIDCLNAASLTSIHSVEIISRKNTKSLEGAPYLLENNIFLDKVEDEEYVVFEGPAYDAIKGFPKNVNVAALLSLSTIGTQKTRVKIIASKKIKSNNHEIKVKGDFGELVTITNNVSSPDNPKTSYLAALSACALLKKTFNRVKLGT